MMTSKHIGNLMGVLYALLVTTILIASAIAFFRIYRGLAAPEDAAAAGGLMGIFGAPKNGSLGFPTENKNAALAFGILSVIALFVGLLASLSMWRQHHHQKSLVVVEGNTIEMAAI